MHEPGKSDSRVLPKKVSNKAQRWAAERLEGRRLAKRNSPQATTLRTQGRARVHAALGRVRQVAEQKKGARFTALLHHIYAIDGMTMGRRWRRTLPTCRIEYGAVRTGRNRYDGCMSPSQMGGSGRLVSRRSRTRSSNERPYRSSTPCTSPSLPASRTAHGQDAAHIRRWRPWIKRSKRSR